MLDPLETLTQLSGESATLVIQPVAPMDPRQLTDWTPGEPIELPFTLVFAKAPETSRATTREAKIWFTDQPFSAPYAHYVFQQIGDTYVVLDGATEIGRVQSDNTRVLARGAKYTVKQARARYYVGVMNGFSMELQQ